MHKRPQLPNQAPRGAQWIFLGNLPGAGGRGRHGPSRLAGSARLAVSQWLYFYEPSRAVAFCHEPSRAEPVGRRRAREPSRAGPWDSSPRTAHNLSPGAQSRLILANWGAATKFRTAFAHDARRLQFELQLPQQPSSPISFIFPDFPVTLQALK